ncbi:MAG TPA: CoA-binding protein, partial [Elusimicrobiota bacterium]|nr:CoA-binding protein [Elusimicrobiota bacterium]
PNPARPSNRVASYLMEAGYRIIPVNPGHGEILGEKCYASLKDIPEPVDVVDVFRRPEHVPGLVDEALAAGAKGLWLQDGIDHPEAVARARAKGLVVVVNDCLLRQHVSRMGR